VAVGTLNKITVPDRIAVTAHISGHALNGAFFEIELPMRRKNSFRILLGPTDAGGTVSLTRNELLAKAKQEEELFPMDYVDLQSGWTGEVVVAGVDRAAIRTLRSAFATWSEAGGYPERFLPLLDELDERLAAASPAEPIEVAVDVVPSDIPVRILPRLASAGGGTKP
jgi:hypothetical protein